MATAKKPAVETTTKVVEKTTRTTSGATPDVTEPKGGAGLFKSPDKKNLPHGASSAAAAKPAAGKIPVPTGKDPAATTAGAKPVLAGILTPEERAKQAAAKAALNPGIADAAFTKDEENRRLAAATAAVSTATATSTTDAQANLDAAKARSGGKSEVDKLAELEAKKKSQWTGNQTPFYKRPWFKRLAVGLGAVAAILSIAWTLNHWDWKKEVSVEASSTQTTPQDPMAQTGEAPRKGGATPPSVTINTEIKPGTIPAIAAAPVAPQQAAAPAPAAPVASAPQPQQQAVAAAAASPDVLNELKTLNRGVEELVKINRDMVKWVEDREAAAKAEDEKKAAALAAARLAKLRARTQQARANQPAPVPVATAAPTSPASSAMLAQDVPTRLTLDQINFIRMAAGDPPIK